MKYYVYALVRPEDFRPFYVGATGSPNPRAPRVAQPYRWKRLTPMSEVGATLAALSEKLALLPASEVARFLVQEQ